MQIFRCNKLVRRLKREGAFLRLPRLDQNRPVHVVVIADAGEPIEDSTYRGRWQGCFAIGITNRGDDAPFVGDVREKESPFCPVLWHSGLTRRVASSSFDGETLIGLEGVDAGLAVQSHLEETLTGKRETLLESRSAAMVTPSVVEKRLERLVTLDLHSDSNDLVTNVKSIMAVKGFSKRRKCDIYDLRELRDLGYLRRVSKIRGKTNPTDGGTKILAWQSPTMKRWIKLNHGQYNADFGS